MSKPGTREAKKAREAEIRSFVCTGKKCFESFKLARDVSTSRNRANDHNRHPYRCRFCRKWHLGTDKGGGGRKRAAAARAKKAGVHAAA